MVVLRCREKKERFYIIGVYGSATPNTRQFKMTSVPYDQQTTLALVRFSQLVKT